jgi:DNA-binding PadR family transcriptional regulator
MTGGLRIKITVLDRILLHLHSYRTNNFENNAPEELTQMGIGLGIDINYSHVPRAVKRLQEQGLIIEKTVHIQSQPTGRRRKAYFLTDSGLKIAKDLLVGLAEYDVDFKDKSGKISKISLVQVKRNLKTKENLFTLYKFLASDNIFDAVKWETTKEKVQMKSTGNTITKPGVKHTGKILTEVEASELTLEDVQKLLGKRFSTEEVDAIFYHTNGNPHIIKTITEFDSSSLKELKELSPEERALTLCLMARAKLEKMNEE